MSDDEGQVARIEALLDLGRYSDAEARVRDQLVVEPENGSLHRLLASALLCQENPSSALLHARAAVRLEPESADPLKLLASTLTELGHGHEAHPVALQAVHLAPWDWMSHLTLAHTLTFGIGGRDALATAELAAHRAVSLAPNSPDAHNLFGVIRWRRDDLRVAETAFRRALAIDPQHADAQRNLASLQIDRIDLVSGVDTLTRALGDHPQDRGMHDELDRASARLLGKTTFWMVLSALVWGGFCLVMDFPLRQRVFFGTVTLFAVGSHAFAVARRMPGPGLARLLPWRTLPGMRLGTWIAWCMNGLALLVSFAPRSVADPAWFLLFSAASVVAGRILLQVLIADSEPQPR